MEPLVVGMISVAESLVVIASECVAGRIAETAFAVPNYCHSYHSAYRSLFDLVLQMKWNATNLL